MAAEPNILEQVTDKQRGRFRQIAERVAKYIDAKTQRLFLLAAAVALDEGNRLDEALDLADAYLESLLEGRTHG